MNKEIMTRSRLRNKFLRCRSDENKKKTDNEQRNCCVKFVWTVKKAHYSNLSIKYVNKNKTFWKIIKPLFSENSNENIALVDNNNISSEIEIAEKLNVFLVKSLTSKLKKIYCMMSLILTIQLKLLFRNTKTILA